MEYKYTDRTSGTGLVRTALPFIAAIAFSLIPSDNYIIPRQTSVSYGDYAETNTQSVMSSNSHLSEDEQVEILLSFASKLSENTKDLDMEIAQIISNDFWEMYDRF